jgi:outer membrane protein OmpA-like peptidoglycan-associated protein
MNSNIILGGITFLLWSTVSSWYYVCNIKGLCNEVDQIEVETISPPVVEEQKEVKMAELAPVAEEEPTLVQINIKEEKIYFLINSSAFLDQSYMDQFLQDLMPQIKDRTVEIEIVGFTCDLGKASYNLELGLQRAKAVKAYLIKNSITSTKIEVSSKGEIPAVAGTEEERKQNRKVSITIKSIDS